MKQPTVDSNNKSLQILPANYWVPTNIIEYLIFDSDVWSVGNQLLKQDKLIAILNSFLHRCYLHFGMTGQNCQNIDWLLNIIFFKTAQIHATYPIFLNIIINLGLEFWFYNYFYRVRDSSHLIKIQVSRPKINSYPVKYVKCLHQSFNNEYMRIKNCAFAYYIHTF